MKNWKFKCQQLVAYLVRLFTPGLAIVTIAFLVCLAAYAVTFFIGSPDQTFF